MRRVVAIGIAMLALAADRAIAQRTSVSSDFPIYNNKGLPDLTVDPKRFVSQMEIVDRLFHTGDCELVEGSVGGTGYRRLLRFDTVLINSGNGDLRLVIPRIRRIRTFPYSSSRPATGTITSAASPTTSL